MCGLGSGVVAGGTVRTAEDVRFDAVSCYEPRFVRDGDFVGLLLGLGFAVAKFVIAILLVPHK